jgi:coproporphyrinogen III oxidase-like Fe-S oxidoreductase
MLSGPFQAPFHGRACPFCGVATDVPHETQEGCIEALHDEIARMRGILDRLRPLGRLASPLDHPDDSGV